MNQKILLSITGILAAIVVLLGGIKVQIGDNDSALGSADLTESYIATTTTDNTHPMPTIALLKTGGGQLGSIVVLSTAGPNAIGSLAFYDATTTITTGGAGSRASTIATGTIIIASTTVAQGVGTYVLDAQFTTGLLVEKIGSFGGDYVITYK